MIVPETFFSVHEELLLFGISCLAGAVIGAAYDVLRALRLIFPHNTWLTAIEDLLFMAVYGVFLQSFASAAARGHLRGYFVIGNILGFAVYHATVGNVVIGTFRKLIRLIGTVFSAIFRPMRQVCALIGRKAQPKFVGYTKNLVKSFKKIKMLLLKLPLLLYNKKENTKKRIVRRVAKKKPRKK